MVFETRSGYSIIGDDPKRQQKGATQGTLQFRLRVAAQHCNPMAPFASISSNIFNRVGEATADPKSRREANTETNFPTELCHKANPCPNLAGLGVRAKRLLGLKNINVYALGIYVDSAAAKNSLSSHKSKDEAALSQDQQLFDDVVNGSFEKSLRLVISFGHLSRGQFLSALQERLEPRLKQGGEPATLALFEKQFDDVTFQRGTEIVFVQDGKNLVTRIDGKERGVITSPTLCRSLFFIYLGTDPVAPDAKATFGRTLASILKE